MKTGKETDLTFVIPDEVSHVPIALQKAGHEAYLVGGCVRDLILGKKPKDWDATTNAKPEAIVSLFENTFYENDYGTVGIVNDILPKIIDASGKEVEDETLKVIEVTPYRIEGGYSDKRRPDSVIFSDKLGDDLKRRDFTINAIALSLDKKIDTKENSFSVKIVDPYDGAGDLKKKIVRTVGKPSDRFNEDALRLLRAVRIAVELDFEIESETLKAIKENSELLKHISIERVRYEFVRILMSQNPMKGINMAQKLDILKFIAPELEKGIGVEQPQAHSYDVWEHLLRSLQHAADKNLSLEIRLAALFHDIAKPETRRRSTEKNEWTFYGHDVVGARVTKQILTRLKFPKETIETVSNLVRWHMFFTDTEQITLSAVRRMINNVGKDHIWDLMDLRICDRIGTGRPKEDPYRLRKYHAMIDEALRDPISVAMLKINGKVLMDKGIKSGPKIGYILNALLEEVLDDPKLNTSEYLEKRAGELMKLDDLELKKMGEQGKEKKEEADQKDVEEIRKKHWVK